jgi:uncharacterized protein YbjT (DUF2867 family)
MRISVAGGTGEVGTHVVAVARERGQDVVVLSRASGVDLIDGTRAAAALAAVEVVIDVTNMNTREAAESVAFFEAVTRTLLAAEVEAGVGHHVVLSIVGPRMRTQPIAAREVAEHLVSVAEAPPAGRARELGGPREERLVDMVRAVARHRGSRAWVPAIPFPGATGRAQRDGSLLPGRDAVLGTQPYAEWLAALS